MLEMPNIVFIMSDSMDGRGIGCMISELKESRS